MKQFINKQLRKIEDENKRKSFLIYCFGILSILMLLVFLIEGIMTKQKGIFFDLTLGFFGLVVFSDLIYFYLRKNIKVSAHILSILFFPITALSILGPNNGAVLWFFLYTPLTLLLTNAKTGIIYNISLLIVAVFLFKVSSNFSINAYSNNFIIRFLISYIILNCVIFIYEYTRSSAYNAYMNTLNGIKKINFELVSAQEELKQQNEEILIQNNEIEQQKFVIEKKNKDLTESIQYAQRIQEAMLPATEILATYIPEHFILFKPCDIVSGDFYWIRQIKNFIFVAAADCTGHGVPGALMSMLGISLLNEIVTEREVGPPNEILNELRKRIKKSLHQDGRKGEAKDGMDIAFCIIDLENHLIQFSGAHNPLYLIRRNFKENNYELYETKADKMPIGIHDEDNVSFTNNKIHLENNDTIYLFSDGYVSQFGGEKREKFKSQRFHEILLKIQNESMDIQKVILNETIISWQGKHEQIDDILLIGLKINEYKKVADT
jgi:serine phosphatase RsbU (regulator of sigma subunit)